MIAIWLCTSDSFTVWMDYFSFCKKKNSLFLGIPFFRVTQSQLLVWFWNKGVNYLVFQNNGVFQNSTHFLNIISPQNVLFFLSFHGYIWQKYFCYSFLSSLCIYKSFKLCKITKLSLHSPLLRHLKFVSLKEKVPYAEKIML